MRLQQYSYSIAAWQKETSARGWRLAVVETSESLGQLRESVGLESEDLTMLGYRPTAAELARGKGAVEASALDEVFQALNDTFEEDEAVFKVTGRLTIANLARCIASLPARTVMVRSTPDYSRVDTRLFGLS